MNKEPENPKFIYSRDSHDAMFFAKQVLLLNGCNKLEDLELHCPQLEILGLTVLGDSSKTGCVAIKRVSGFSYNGIGSSVLQVVSLYSHTTTLQKSANKCMILHTA